ncbi:39S ribosomal protein L17, mitochondrial-like [Argonauta hians]
MLKFVVRARPRKMSATLGLGGGPASRIERLRRTVTAIIRYERIESYYHRLDEARGYTERLIQLAIKNGPRDQRTMEMADYWLLEKDLVLKLFKVLAPRYSNYDSSFTEMFKLPTVYPGSGSELGILELKGNPWPPVRPHQTVKDQYLINQLLEGVKEKTTGLPFPQTQRNEHSQETDQQMMQESLVHNFDQMHIESTEESTPRM